MKRNTPFPILVEQREKNESKLGKLGKMKPGSNYMLEKKKSYFLALIWLSAGMDLPK